MAPFRSAALQSHLQRRTRQSRSTKPYPHRKPGALQVHGIPSAGTPNLPEHMFPSWTAKLRNGVSGMARLSGAALLLEDDFPFGWEADVESAHSHPHRVPLRSSRIRRPGQPAHAVQHCTTPVAVRGKPRAFTPIDRRAKARNR